MKKSYLKRKDNIILTAIEIIDEMGFQGLTIREISSRQEVTEAAIYRHFKSKKDIIMAVLDQFSQYDSMIWNTIIQQQLSPKEGIMFYIMAFTEFYENYPAITSMLFADCMLHDEPAAQQRLKDIFNERKRCMNKLITDCQDSGELFRLVPADDIAIMILGLTKEMILSWKNEGMKYQLKKRITGVLEALFAKCTA